MSYLIAQGGFTVRRVLEATDLALRFPALTLGDPATLVTLARSDAEARDARRPWVSEPGASGAAQTQNADPRGRIGVRCIPGSLQTFRRSTPVPSKGTFRLAMLIPNS